MSPQITDPQLAQDFDYLLAIMDELNVPGRPARLEISLDGGAVVAQILAELVAVPLAARGTTAARAVHALRKELDRVAAESKRRR